MTNTALIAAAASAYISGCSLTDPPGACSDICSIWTIVEGTVTTAAEGPVPEAEVRLRLMYAGLAAGGEITCQLSEERFVTQTDSAGAFSHLLRSVSLVLPHCVEVEVPPPPGSTFAASVDTILVAWSIEQDSAPVSTIAIMLLP
jgi:hypothetical protein